MKTTSPTTQHGSRELATIVDLLLSCPHLAGASIPQLLLWLTGNLATPSSWDDTSVSCPLEVPWKPG